jgi:hypothetical protein
LLDPQTRRIIARRISAPEISHIGCELSSGAAGKPDGITGSIIGASSISFGFGLTKGTARAAKSTACSTGL